MRRGEKKGESRETGKTGEEEGGEVKVKGGIVRGREEWWKLREEEKVGEEEKREVVRRKEKSRERKENRVESREKEKGLGKVRVE